MTFSAERRAVETYFAAHWTACPVAYQNVPFTPPDDQVYVRLAVAPGSSQLVGLGRPKLHRHQGSIIAQVSVASGTGGSAALALADRVVGLFRDQVIGGLVHCRSPRVAVDDGGDAGRFEIAVITPYWRDAWV